MYDRFSIRAMPTSRSSGFRARHNLTAARGRQQSLASIYHLLTIRDQRIPACNRLPLAALDATLALKFMEVEDVESAIGRSIRMPGYDQPRSVAALPDARNTPDPRWHAKPGGQTAESVQWQTGPVGCVAGGV